MRVEDERWTRRDELQAATVEMLHELWATLIRVNSSRPPHIPAFRIPRPGDVDQVDEDAVSHSEMMRLGGFL